MRGVVLAAVVLLAAVAGPTVAARASGADGGAAGPAVHRSPDVAGAPASAAAKPGYPGAARTRVLPVGPAGARGRGARLSSARTGGTTPLYAVDANRDGRGRAADRSARTGSAAADRDTLRLRGGEPAVTVAHELNLTPDRPGALRVTLRPEVPEGAGPLSVGLSDRATVVNATGFARRDGRYRLNASAESASLTYRVSVNRTAEGGELVAVDAGSWALVRTPTPSLSVAGATVERRYTVDGAGVVGPGLTYLGPHRTYDRTVHGQHIELVVPAAAEMRSRPTAVVAALATAARTLAVGDRDRTVLFVAAPTTVDWAYAAQQVGDADAWVRADQSLHAPRNAWLHEYVHTRQAFRTTRETRWLVEGIATYYAALLSLRQGLVDFEQFRRHLLAGTAERNREAVLAAPRTWRGSRAEYRKGALVVGTIDRRIRVASDGWRSFQRVFRQLNAHEGPVGMAALASMVEDAGGSLARSMAVRYATEPVAPEPWNEAGHRIAFGWSPPSVSTSLAGLAAVGPGGRRSLGAATDVVVITTDERLVATVRATNDGGWSGSFVGRMAVNFTTVDRVTARVGPGETTTVRVAHDFRGPGTYYVVVAGEAVEVRVVRPARSVEVTDVKVRSGDGVTDGEVTVVTRVHNPRDRPAVVSLPVTVDGEVVATRRVSVGPNQRRRVSTTLQLDGSGDYRIVVAGESARVTVRPSGHVVTAAPSTPADTGPGPLSPTPAGGSGLGLLAALTLVALGATVVRRRW